MNNCFSIESFGTLDHPMRHLPFAVKRTSAQVRAIMEAIVTDHFGSEILDQLFEIYTKKLTENSLVFEKEIRKSWINCSSKKGGLTAVMDVGRELRDLYIDYGEKYGRIRKGHMTVAAETGTAERLC
ncbi:hypothetical protein RJ639_026266 [Escallonia herrerae]|uniref:Uncharacterized protein n=1 Tax=Escallonia herrerae TaxID=1293975 RepID=A0AA88UWZ6_9ASTE|nr:hypothetical protein RJ639_026266 [Escallonia herrerae]